MALAGTAALIAIIYLASFLTGTTKIQHPDIVIPGPTTSPPPAAAVAKTAPPPAKPDKQIKPVTKEMPPLIVRDILKEIDPPAELAPGESTSAVAIAGNGVGSEEFSLPVEIAASNVIVQPVMKKDAADRPFMKVEIEARFPGGEKAWYEYISKALLRKIGRFTEADFGTCNIRFIVDTDGKVSDVTILSPGGTLLEKIALETIQNGPDWIPAKQNGQFVKAYRTQPISFKIADY
jgi:protein TonB